MGGRRAPAPSAAGASAEPPSVGRQDRLNQEGNSVIPSIPVITERPRPAHHVKHPGTMRTDRREWGENAYYHSIGGRVNPAPRGPASAPYNRNCPRLGTDVGSGTTTTGGAVGGGAGAISYQFVRISAHWLPCAWQRTTMSGYAGASRGVSSTTRPIC